MSRYKSELDKLIDREVAPHRRTLSSAVKQSAKHTGSIEKSVQIYVEKYWVDFVNNVGGVQALSVDPVDYVEGIFFMLGDQNWHKIAIAHLKSVKEGGFTHLSANSHWDFTKEPAAFEEATNQKGSEKKHEIWSFGEWLRYLLFSSIGLCLLVLFLNGINYASYYWPAVSFIADMLPVISPLIMIAGFPLAIFYFGLPFLSLICLVMLPYIAFVDIKERVKRKTEQSRAVPTSV